MDCSRMSDFRYVDQLCYVGVLKHCIALSCKEQSVSVSTIVASNMGAFLTTVITAFSCEDVEERFGLAELAEAAWLMERNDDANWCHLR